MLFHSWLLDHKIHGLNVSADISLGDYADLAKQIIDNNDLQRRRVTARGQPYELLRRDLLDGCIMPPIILALSESSHTRLNGLIESALAADYIEPKSRQAIEDVLRTAVNEGDLVILDGLQRTFTINECLADAEANGTLHEVRRRTIRIEIYAGLSKAGILYRMLTLNTGQTPMSFRHQIEMLYHDYLDSDGLPDGIRIYREVDQRRARGIGSYKYSDVVDMFYAFSTGTAKSLDKQTLVTKLAEMDFLESYRPDSDDMLQLLVAYNAFVARLYQLSEQWNVGDDSIVMQQVERPFGCDVSSIFEKVQPMTAFGAECKRLIKQGQLASVDNLHDLIQQCKFHSKRANEALGQLIVILDQVSKRASKIGPAQRELFQYSFRAVFNADSETYLDLGGCWLSGQERYESLAS